jgi:hypothetical protein
MRSQISVVVRSILTRREGNAGSLHEQKPQNRYHVQVNLAQELLFNRGIDLVLHCISIGLNSSVLDLQLFELVIFNVGIHLDEYMYAFQTGVNV